MNLLDNIKLCKGTSDGFLDCDGTTFYGAPIDMKNGHSVLWLVHLTSQAGIKGSTGITLYMQGCSSTGGTFVTYSSGINCLSKATGAIGPSLDHRLMAMDVIKPLMSSAHRYLRPVIQGCSGWINIIGIQYGLHRVGTSQAYASTYIGGTTRIVGASS